MRNILKDYKGCDGAHWGLTDRYPEVESLLEEALTVVDEWTTGWYSSKKEIASCKITHVAGFLTVEVSVTDDLDSEGLGCVSINEHTIEAIDKAIGEAWELAEKDQDANKDYTGYSIISGNSWVETYIQKRNDGWMMDDG